MNLLAEVAEGARHRAELIVATSFPANLAIPPFRSTDCSASADLNGTPAGWYVCDEGRCRVKSSREESGQSSWAVPVRLFVHALHDCFTRPKRERASQDLSHCHQTKFDSGSSSLCELPERRMPKVQSHRPWHLVQPPGSALGSLSSLTSSSTQATQFYH